MEKIIAFGSRLKEIRNMKDMTQLELSRNSGVERTFISHIEAGHKNVSIKTMTKLFDALGISFGKFFSSEDFK